MFRYTILQFYDAEKGSPNFFKLFSEFESQIPSQLRKRFIPPNEMRCELPLKSKSPELEAAKKRAEELGLEKTHAYEAVYYTKKEQDSALFYMPQFPEPMELAGDSLREFGTEYQGACEHCHQFGKPVGDVLVDRKYLKKTSIGTFLSSYFGASYIVSEEVRALIEENSFTGVSFEQEVKDYKGRETGKFYALTVRNKLPPLSPEASVIQRNQNSCGHSYLYCESDLMYERVKLENACDFNITSEWFFYRGPYLVISNRVKQAFQENKIKVYWYVPVLLI